METGLTAQRLVALPHHGKTILLAAPYMIALLLFFIIPFSFVVSYSITSNNTMPSGAHYERLVREPVYWSVIVNTVSIAALVTVFCAVLGFPAALFLTRVSGRWRRLVLCLVLVPFWTSLLVRTYAWLVLLQQQGVVNRVLIETRLVDSPLSLVHNRLGVVVGMTYVLMPFMVLSIYAILKDVDHALPLAAATLGAGRMMIFWRVLVPLGLPGVTAGTVLVFVLSLGYFITPALLGGLSETTIGMVIEAQMNRLLDWGFGSALSVSLTTAVLLLAAIAHRWLDPKLLAGEDD